ncbi:MAG: hypothetical protein ABI646_02255 [Acidobacteriota bacterium]
MMNKKHMQPIHSFAPGDFLIFQLESSFALLRVLDVEKNGADTTWHLAAYKDFFLETEMAEAALDRPEVLQVEKEHIALTNHAFESTPVARLRNVPLKSDELEGYNSWKASRDRDVHDRSIRLLLGLR